MDARVVAVTHPRPPSLPGDRGRLDAAAAT
jgi:hypothetical protein